VSLDGSQCKFSSSGTAYSKMVAQRTQSNGAATAHARSEVRRKKSRNNIAAEVENPRTEAPTRLRVALRDPAWAPARSRWQQRVDSVCEYSQHRTRPFQCVAVDGLLVQISKAITITGASALREKPRARLQRGRRQRISSQCVCVRPEFARCVHYRGYIDLAVYIAA
jgi:hypothetical protein